MPNNTWVKNVYSLCVDSTTSSVYSYTTTHLMALSSLSSRVQTVLLNSFIPTFKQASFTAFLNNFNLLNTGLYTLSTAPIISTMNQKIRKDS